MALNTFETQERQFSFMEDAREAALRDTKGQLTLTPEELIIHWDRLDEAARRLGVRMGATRQ